MSVRTRPGVARLIRTPDAERKQGRAPTQIGDHNLRVTLEAIRRDGPLTRLELGRRTGLTGPGITNILRRLADDGLVTARKRVERGGGQPSTEFAINSDGAFSVGIRLREMEGEAVLLTLGGEVCERRSFDTTSDPVAAIEKVALSMTIARGSSVRMLGVGVASEDPGAHDLGRLTETGLFSRVFFERDCVTALLAESTFGVGRVEGGIMLIIVDQRVRAGFLFRGAPFGGVHNRAGSIGLMRTGADHVPLELRGRPGRFLGEVELDRKIAACSRRGHRGQPAYPQLGPRRRRASGRRYCRDGGLSGAGSDPYRRRPPRQHRRGAYCADFRGTAEHRRAACRHTLDFANSPDNVSRRGHRDRRRAATVFRPAVAVADVKDRLSVERSADPHSGRPAGFEIRRLRDRCGRGQTPSPCRVLFGY